MILIENNFLTDDKEMRVFISDEEEPCEHCGDQSIGSLMFDIGCFYYCSDCFQNEYPINSVLNSFFTLAYNIKIAKKFFEDKWSDELKMIVQKEIEGKNSLFSKRLIFV